MQNHYPSLSALKDPRVAVVGCGAWGKNLIRSFAELGVLDVVVDVDAKAAEAMVALYGGRTASFDSILMDKTVEAIAIAAPAAEHFALASRALRGGKHVFVEKPLALDLAEAEELCALAERFDRRLMVGHLLQYHPCFLALRSLVATGQLGPLRSIQSRRLNLGKFRQEEDVLWSFAPHDLSMILSLMGAEPHQVTSTAGNFLHDRIADLATIHMAFSGGETAQVFVSWLHPEKEQKLIVVGANAMAVFDDNEVWERKLVLYRHRVEWRDGRPWPIRAAAEPVAVPRDEPLRLECRHFLDCVRAGATPRTDGREGLRVLRVLARATASLQAEPSSQTAVPTPAKPRVARQYPGVTIHESAYVDDGVDIGEGTRIWHFSHILGQVSIGRKVSIGQNVVIGPRVSVGNNVKIQNNVSVFEGVTLEDGVFCGPSCVFTNVHNPRAEISRKDEFRTTHVRRGATIGANATIVCGNELGAYCFIAAGAVVTRNVPAYALMVGAPARRVGWMSQAGGKLGVDLICPLTGTHYREVGADLLEEIAGTPACLLPPSMDIGADRLEKIGG